MSLTSPQLQKRWEQIRSTALPESSRSARNQAGLNTIDVLYLTPSAKAANGLLSGSFNPDSTAKPTSFTGVLLPRQRVGHGVYQAPTQSQTFELSDD